METKKIGMGPAIAFAVAILAALPLRVWQYLKVVEDSGTGFYRQVDWSVWALYALTLALILICILSGLTRRKTVGYLRSGARKSVLGGLLSVLAAGGVAYDGLLCLNARFSLGLPLTLPGDPELSAAAASIYLLEGVFGLLATVFFLLFGVGLLSGRQNESGVYKLLSLAPLLWAVFRTVTRFTRTISYIRVSDLLFELLMLCFFMMFFMAFAQCEAKISDQRIPWKLQGYGLPAAFLGLLCFAPRCLMLLTGHGEVIYTHSTAEVCDLTTALWIAVVALTRSIPHTEPPIILPEKD